MNEKSVLQNSDNHAMITVLQVSIKDADKLARLHLALAQEYRRIAGLKPVMTGSQQRKVAANANK